MTPWTRRRVLAFRMRAQQLGRRTGTIADTAVLDLGVQDSGPDGARWALALRGLPDADPAALALVWTIRGAPHVYRRADLPEVAAATAPFSEADAGKRIFDAAKPLKAAGIPVLSALDTVADRMREIVDAPMVKGEMSGRLTAALDEPYLRHCRPCGATHAWEQPFRLAALRAGLELQPGTSPPVLQPIPGFTTIRASTGTATTAGPATDGTTTATGSPTTATATTATGSPTTATAFAPAGAATAATSNAFPHRLDVIRGCLRLLGPTTPALVAGYLDARVADVRARWPADAVELDLDGERRWLLNDDLPGNGSPSDDADPLDEPFGDTLLLGPFDLFLQARDRSLLVPDRGRAKALWPVLGRPGAVLHDGEIAGLWRPKKSGATLTVSVQPWVPVGARFRSALEEQAEHLAVVRGAQNTQVRIDE